MLEKIKYMIVALLVALFINSFLVTEPRLALQDPNEVVNSDQDSYQLSDQLQGVWRHPKEDGTEQVIQLRGNQIIISDELTGSTYYSLTDIIQDPDWQASDPDKVDYQDLFYLYWDANDYLDRYGEEALPEELVPFQAVYDSQEDILYTAEDVAYYRDEFTETLIVLREGLTANEPINQLQLQEFTDDELMKLYLPIQEQGLEFQESINLLYQALTRHEKGQELLTGDDYSEYMQVINQIRRNSELTRLEINQAGPRHVLDWYRQSLNEFEGQSEAEVIAHIEPKIQAARQDYLTRLMAYQNGLKVG